MCRGRPERELANRSETSGGDKGGVWVREVAPRAHHQGGRVDRQKWSELKNERSGAGVKESRRVSKREQDQRTSS